MRAILGLALVISLASGAVGPARADIGVDLELVLAIDSSGSVTFGEFELQAGGIARAFRDPEVIEAIQGAAPNGIAVCLIQWSGRRQHLVTIDWTHVTGAGSAQALAARIDAMGRSLIGETAIANALQFAQEQLAYGPFQGTRQIIDLSGDGPTNAGGDPDPIRDAAARAGITINGLAILNESPTLDRYYAEHVIGGPDAFVMTAKDYDDFAHAIRQKLLREIRGAPLADAEPGRPPRGGGAVARHGARTGRQLMARWMEPDSPRRGRSSASLAPRCASGYEGCRCREVKARGGGQRANED